MFLPAILACLRTSYPPARSLRQSAHHGGDCGIEWAQDAPTDATSIDRPAGLTASMRHSAEGMLPASAPVGVPPPRLETRSRDIEVVAPLRRRTQPRHDLPPLRTVRRGARTPAEYDPVRHFMRQRQRHECRSIFAKQHGIETNRARAVRTPGSGTAQIEHQPRRVRRQPSMARPTTLQCRCLPDQQCHRVRLLGQPLMRLLIGVQALLSLGSRAFCRKAAWTGAVSGRTPRQSSNENAACSMSMPRPSSAPAAPCAHAQR